MNRTGVSVAIAMLAACVATTATAQSQPRIPLTTGLTIVTAVREVEGDFESIKRVVSINQDAIELSYSVRTPKRAWSVRRMVRLIDLRDATMYKRAFGEHDDPVYPGTTAIGASTAVLNALKAGREVPFRTQSAHDTSGSTPGVLKRVETRPVPLPVIVNGARVQLPAVHAHGTLTDQGFRGINRDEEEADFYFLDDPDNPMCLRSRVDSETLNVVQIISPPASAGNVPLSSIEQALEKNKRAEVYGIYFDFGSARIREESEPVLREIAAIMAKNPGWNLTVEGHTDNIGGDAKNLDLSNRRAAAVKDALVTRYHIASERLTPAGFGASRPKDTNSTLQGRARNRRVELARQ